jgi:catechol 2,3-dioxygenase-like lactoylglutathione lyase family enzyme
MARIVQNHFVLAVHDLRASSRFFENLGFKIESEPEGWTFLGRDNCMVMLGECSDALPPRQLGDHSYFGYLRVDDVDSYYEEVVAKGVTIRSPIATKPWNMREFTVESPEGHRLTIGQWIGTQ